MKLDEAITAAAAWYRERYAVEGPIEIRSIWEDEDGGYYCELRSSAVASSISVMVYAGTGRVEAVGEGLERITVRTVMAGRRRRDLAHPGRSGRGAHLDRPRGYTA
jgi:hypothetical protein